jgi:hypothetical protein
VLVLLLQRLLVLQVVRPLLVPHLLLQRLLVLSRAVMLLVLAMLVLRELLRLLLVARTRLLAG